MKSLAVLVAGALSLASSVYGHGYMVIPSSRSRLGAEVRTPSFPNIFGCPSKQGPVADSPNPSPALILVPNATFSNPFLHGQILPLRQSAGVVLAATMPVSALTTTRQPPIGETRLSSPTRLAKSSMYSGVLTTTETMAACSVGVSARTRPSSTSS